VHGHLLGRSRVLAGALVAGLALVACAGQGGAPRASATSLPPCRPTGVVSVGERIPTGCAFERLDGGVLRLSSLLGKPAVINFWASWCTFCIDEMPAFERVHEALGDRVTFVGADLLGVQGETRSLARDFARRTGVRYVLVFDEGGMLYGHFSAQLLMPVTIFVRPDGVVAHRRFGPLDEAKLRELLRTHLGVADQKEASG
jgi:thiol-disulfide isomerase/thioredoxin